MPAGSSGVSFVNKNGGRVGVAVGVCVLVGVGVDVDVDVAVAVAVAVAVGGTGVKVAVGLGVSVLVAVGRTTMVLVTVGGVVVGCTGPQDAIRMTDMMRTIMIEQVFMTLQGLIVATKQCRDYRLPTEDCQSPIASALNFRSAGYNLRQMYFG